MKKLALAAVCAALVATPLTARANGRFPESNQIVFSSADPDLVLLRVTFGLLVSRDRGQSWSWVCEGAIGFSGVEDPMYAVTPGGSLLATTFLGLSVSPDRACSWSFAGGPLENLVFIDLSQRPGDPKSIVTFASSYEGQDADGGIFFSSQLFETADEGKTFTVLGPKLDKTLLGETVDVTTTDPDRLYISAVRDPGVAPKAVLLTSRDKGQTWEENVIALEDTERSVYIAAVDPTNADRVYVRTRNATDKPTRLLVTDDAGKTFRTVYRAQGALTGFAITPDGTKVYVGGALDGVRVASTTDFSFQQKSSIKVGCLAVSSDGLWACSDEPSGFIAGVSTDDGATFQPKLRFCQITGPLDCPVGTSTHTMCTLGGAEEPRQPPWPAQRALLGCGNVTIDAGPADGGASSGGPSNGAAPGDDGCSCRMAPASSWAGLTAAGLGLLALARRRSRTKENGGAR